MHDAFVPFEVAFAALTATPAEAAAEDAAEPASGQNGPVEFAKMDAACDPHVEALAGVRRFRAALAEALELQLADLLRDLACEVLGRELQLAPADVAAIARRALEHYAAENPLRLRAHSRDAPGLAALALPVVIDDSLRRGDVTIEVRCGTIDASLGARVEALLGR
ncbi:MAG TPA: FliH/SctL family protein [Candidatus Tumulicola sp.]|nr:FliH/SctL family protein [Candidatus Tumulicola sp.]